MYFIDTHTHLFTEEFDSDRDQVIDRAISNGVKCMLLPNIDSSTIPALKSTVERYKSNCMPMMGLHPGSVNENYQNELKIIKDELFKSSSYIAVGEIGIDLYWDKSFINEQKSVFITQCEWAVELDLPISIHTRSAFVEVIECLNSMSKIPKGIFHCFTGNKEEADIITALGFKLGIGGVVTYKNSLLPDVLKQLRLESLVLETDSPYLPPVPYRGKRNESAYIPIIAEKLSEIFGVSNDSVSEITSATAKSIFKI